MTLATVKQAEMRQNIPVKNNIGLKWCYIPSVCDDSPIFSDVWYVRVKHKFDFRVCAHAHVCFLQPEHYKLPPVERTDDQLIYNAQLLNDDYYTQMNSM